MSKKELLFLGLGLLIAGLIYITCIDTQAIGFFHDDGSYIATAKALALGQGYRHPDVVEHPWHARYPIGYPLFLSMGWLLQPEFPGNLWLLSFMTMMCTILGLGTLYVYLRSRYRFSGWESSLICGLVACNVRLLFYSTAIMSEGLYFLLSLLTLFAVESPSFNKSKWLFWAVVILSVASFHTRLFGIALIFGISAWLLLQRQYKRAVLYTSLSCMLSVGAWSVWQRYVQVLNERVDPWIQNAYLNYGLILKDTITYTNYWQSLGNALWMLAQKIASSILPAAFNLPYLLNNPQLSSQSWYRLYAAVGFPALTCVLLGVIGYKLFKGSPKMPLMAWLRILPPSAWYVTFYMLILLVWGQSDQVARFLLMMQPWIWILVFWSLRGKVTTFKQSWIVPLSPALILLAGCYFLTFPSGYKLVEEPRKNHWLDEGPYRLLWQDYQQTFAWINSHVPAGMPIGCERTTAVYLYTGHLIFPLTQLTFSPQQKSPAEFTHSLYNMLRQHNVKYLLLEPVMIMNKGRQMNPLVLDLLHAYPKQVQLVFQSSDKMLKLYQVM